MTVCIATRSFSTVFLISDRMITSGDVQFEPPVSKILFLSSSIAIMAAGDSAFHAEIAGEVSKEITDRITADPGTWVLVKDVVDMYIKYRNAAKVKRSAASILAPLGLTMESWIDKQKYMEQSLVESIARDLINFELPEVSVIIAGVDQSQGSATAHIYSIYNDYISCDDTIGFRAIGSGSRHAESQFMLAGHAWNSGINEAAALAYRAKKDAEVAPGVGKGTDFWGIFGLGGASEVRTGIQELLESEYEKMKSKIKALQTDLTTEVTKYVDNLPVPGSTAQADKPKIIEAPDADAAPEPDPKGEQPALRTTETQKGEGKID